MGSIKNEKEESHNNADLIKNLKEDLKKCISVIISKIETNLNDEYLRVMKDRIKNDISFSYLGFEASQWAIIRAFTSINISKGRTLGFFFEKTVRKCIVHALLGSNITENITKAKDKELKGVYSKETRKPFDKSKPGTRKRGGTYGIDCEIIFDNIENEKIQSRMRKVIKNLSNTNIDYRGVAIEIKYTFMPNDHSRIEKDADFGEILKENNMFPIYLVLSEDDVRKNDAITRLKQSGWNFLMGADSLDFIHKFTMIDLINELFLDGEIKETIDELRKKSQEIFEKHLKTE
ncbi:MAG TPA: hypothetical protein VKM55_00355 [Candidatus Lokiarchaeia archaeon]|nr:hypothetical protein [Candidatus Lokiarchaeia archaeon]